MKSALKHQIPHTHTGGEKHGYFKPSETKKPSPGKFLGAATAALGGSTGGMFSGNVGSLGNFSEIANSIIGGSSNKIKPRVKKLENQVTSILRKQNQGPTQIQETLEVPVGPELNTVPNQIGMEEETPELLANNPTVSSPFSPATEQMAGGMFGDFVPGLDGRDMGQIDTEEEIYS
tara:strand:- start:885 stop:1412 length:528 start_codon:yes stop_codon:yes gene_type:complete